MKTVFKMLKCTEYGECRTDLEASAGDSSPDELRFAQASPVGENGWIAKQDVPLLIAALQAWVNPQGESVSRNLSEADVALSLLREAIRERYEGETQFNVDDRKNKIACRVIELVILLDWA